MRSWKNLVSIGDSTAERFALQDVVYRHVQRGRLGRWKECRCKTLQLFLEPSLEQLQCLPALVTHVADVDVEFDKTVYNVGAAAPKAEDRQLVPAEGEAVPRTSGVRGLRPDVPNASTYFSCMLGGRALSCFHRLYRRRS